MTIKLSPPICKNGYHQRPHAQGLARVGGNGTAAPRCGLVPELSDSWDPMDYSPPGPSVHMLTVNWCSYCGKRHRSFSKNQTQNYHITQQVHSWVYIWKNNTYFRKIPAPQYLEQHYLIQLSRCGSINQQMKGASCAVRAHTHSGILLSHRNFFLRFAATWMGETALHLVMDHQLVKYRNQTDSILCSQRWRSSIQSAKRRAGADCGSNHELRIAKFRLKVKIAGKSH